MIELIFLISLLVFAVLLWLSAISVPQGYEVVVERLGVFHEILGAGLHFRNVLLFKPKVINWSYNEEKGLKTLITSRIPKTEMTYDPTPLRVLTTEKIEVKINTVIFYQITDSKKAVYNTDNLLRSLEFMIQCKLREATSGLTLDAVHSKLPLDKDMFKSTDITLTEWGVEVKRVEIQSISLPQSAQSAIEKSFTMERESRSKILVEKATRELSLYISETEGKVREQKLKADLEESRFKVEREISDKKIRLEQEINEQKMRAEARVLGSEMEARAEAKRFKMMKEVGASDEYLTSLLQAESFRQLAKNANKGTLILPYESANLIGSVKGLQHVLGTSSPPANNDFVKLS